MLPDKRHVRITLGVATLAALALPVTAGAVTTPVTQSDVRAVEPGGDTIATPTTGGMRKKTWSDVQPCHEPSEGFGMCAIVIKGCESLGGTPRKEGDTWYCRER